MSEENKPLHKSPVSDMFFGWQPSPPDFRDVVFSAPAPIILALPESVDISEPAMPAPFGIWNQSNIGSCGAFSAAGDLGFAGFVLQKLTTMPLPSRLFIYYAARMEMGTVNEDSGVYNRALLKALNKYGWCDDSLWPYVTSKFREKPPQQCWEQAATRKISQYLAVPQQLEQMKGCLAGGDAVIFGFTVYDVFMRIGSDGVMAMPQAGAQVHGGHDVVLCGYSDRTQLFKARNSHGLNFGQRGYFYIPYSFATNPRMASDFWTVKHSALPDVVPPPPDPPGPPNPPMPGSARVTVTLADGRLFSGTLAQTI